MTPAEGGRGRRGALKWIVAAASGLGLALALWLGSPGRPGRVDVLASLPELPDLAGRPETLVHHLTVADRAARDDPGAVGRLGMAYHADNFYDRAAICYALASELEPAEWRWDYYAALIAEELGASELASRTLERVVSRKPDLALAWFRLGEAALKGGRLDEAREAYERARRAGEREGPTAPGAPELGSRTFPIAAYASQGLARVLIEERKPEEALGILERLAEERPDLGPAQRLLGRAYEKLGREREARERYARASYCAPYHPPADPLIDELARESSSSTFLLKQMGVARQSENLSWAELLARRAVEVNPEDLDAVARLGLLLLSAGRPEEALPHLDRYRRMQPEDDITLAKMGYGLAVAGDTRGGIEYLEQALRVNPDSVDAHASLGIAKGRLGRLDEAVRHCEAALRIRTDDVRARRHLAVFLKEQGKIDEAIGHCEEILRIRETSAEGHNDLGFLLTVKGELDAAKQHVQQALRLRPDYAEAHNNLYMILARKGDLAGARRHLEQAIRVKPDYAEAHNNLAALVIQATGDRAEARRHLEAAIEADPTYYRAHDNLGALHEREGRWLQAIEHYRIALRHQPDAALTQRRLAWLLSTCPDAELRDGREALVLARTACEATGRRDPNALDALGAALAECGLHDQAARAQQEALEVLGPGATPAQRDSMRSRVELYLQGKPFRLGE